MADDLQSISEFVAEFCAIPQSQLSATSRLEEDLGVSGDDAADLLEAFSTRYSVDLSSIRPHRHFWPEGLFFTLFLPRWLRDQLKDHGRYPVTIGHLVDVARAGHWFDPPEHGMPKHRHAW